MSVVASPTEDCDSMVFDAASDANALDCVMISARMLRSSDSNAACQ